MRDTPHRHGYPRGYFTPPFALCLFLVSFRAQREIPLTSISELPNFGRRTPFPGPRFYIFGLDRGFLTPCRGFEMTPLYCAPTPLKPIVLTMGRKRRSSESYWNRRLSAWTRSQRSTSIFCTPSGNRHPTFCLRIFENLLSIRQVFEPFNTKLIASTVWGFHIIS